MVSITLDDRDRAMIERLGRDAADVESLAEETSCDPGYLRERLPELADNGLVKRVDDDAYAATATGERAVRSSPAGTMDDRIDTPTAVEERIQSFDLRPDREEAVRNAFSFLHYWGTARSSEIVDGAYSENPAGFESVDEWWNGFVRGYLADLPVVDAPDETDDEWRFTGTPSREKDTEDGRDAPAGDLGSGSSVKYALERADLDDDERAAIRGAFEYLFREGEATAAELRDRVYPDHDAGYDSPAEWWTDCVRDGLEALPGVESDGDGDSWRYHQSDEGPMSSGPGAEVPDEPLGPGDEDGE